MGPPSVVWNESSDALPRRITAPGGGRVAGHLNIQYSPENGMLLGAIRDAPSARDGEGTGATSVVWGSNTGNRITPGKSPPNPVLSLVRAAACLADCVPDWPPGSEESEGASGPAPPLPRTAIAPVVRAAASKKVHTTLSAECGKLGGLPGRYAPVEMESDVRIAVLMASSTAARNWWRQSKATKPA
jgi:hypothetical protein